MLHTEGTVSYISVLIEKNVHDPCPYGQKLVYLVLFWTQKGKVRLLSRSGSLFADSEKLQLYFQKTFLIKLN